MNLNDFTSPTKLAANDVLEALVAGQPVRHKGGGLYGSTYGKGISMAEATRAMEVGRVWLRGVRDGKPYGPVRPLALNTLSVIKSPQPAGNASTTLPSGAKESVVSKNIKPTKPTAKDVEDLLGKPVKKAVSGKPGAPAKGATAKKAVGQRSDLAGKTLKSAGKEARGLRAVVVEIANGKTYEDALKALVKSAKFEAPRSKARNADKEAFAKNRIARMVALGLLIAK